MKNDFSFSTAACGMFRSENADQIRLFQKPAQQFYFFFCAWQQEQEPLQQLLSPQPTQPPLFVFFTV